MLVWLGWGQGEDRRENHVSFLAQIHHASKVCLGEGGWERNGGTVTEKRNTKIPCGQFLSQGSLTWQQMAYPWRTGSQRAAALRSWF